MDPHRRALLNALDALPATPRNKVRSGNARKLFEL